MSCQCSGPKQDDTTEIRNNSCFKRGALKAGQHREPEFLRQRGCLLWHPCRRLHTLRPRCLLQTGRWFHPQSAQVSWRWVTDTLQFKKKKQQVFLVHLYYGTNHPTHPNTKITFSLSLFTQSGFPSFCPFLHLYCNVINTSDSILWACSEQKPAKAWIKKNLLHNDLKWTNTNNCGNYF